MANNVLKYILTMDNKQFVKLAKDAGVSVDDLDQSLTDVGKTSKKTFGSMVTSISTFTIGLNQGLELVSKFAAGIGSISKNLIEFDKSVTLIEKRFGTTREEAEELNIELQALGETFGVDVNTEIKATNALMNEFGITSQEAVGLISEAAEKIPDQFSELLDQVTEYSSQLNQIGIEADQFLAISIQALQKGVYSDKGVDAIKEFNLRIRELTPTANDALKAIGLTGEEITAQIESGQKTVFDVLKQVSARIREQGINAKVTGQVFADLFGGAGEDAGKFLLEIDKLNDSLATTEDQISEAQKQQLKFNEELEKTTQEISKRLLPLYTQLATAAGKFALEGIDSLATLGVFLDENTNRYEKFVKAQQATNTELDKTGKSITAALDIVGDMIPKTEEASRSILDVFANIKSLSDFVNLANAATSNSIKFIPDPDETEEILETTTDSIEEAFEKIDKSYQKMLGNMNDAPEFVGIGSELWLEQQEEARRRIEEIGASDLDLFKLRQDDKLKFLQESLDNQYITQQEFDEKKKLLSDETNNYEQQNAINTAIILAESLGSAFSAIVLESEKTGEAIGKALIKTLSSVIDAWVATEITKAFASGPLSFGATLAAVGPIVAAGTAGKAALSAIKFAHGGGMTMQGDIGFTTGPSHAQGGTKFITKNQPGVLKEYSGTEFIVGERATDFYNPEALKAINNRQATILYRNGGSTSSNVTSNSQGSASAVIQSNITLEVDGQVLANATNTANNNNSGSGAILTENT